MIRDRSLHIVAVIRPWQPSWYTAGPDHAGWEPQAGGLEHRGGAMHEEVGEHARAKWPVAPPLGVEGPIEVHQRREAGIDAQPPLPVDGRRAHGGVELVVAPLADRRVAEELGLEAEHLAEFAGLDQFTGLVPDLEAGRLHADLHHEARLSPELHHVEGLLDGLGHRLLGVDVLAGLERIDNLAVMPVVGRADADGVYVFVGEQVGVVDVALRIGAGLLLDEGADFVFLVLIDLADGDEVDLRPLLAELGEFVHMGLEAAAARADESDADPGVGVGGNGPRRGGGDSRGGGDPGGGERRSPEERAAGEVGRGHREGSCGR